MSNFKVNKCENLNDYLNCFQCYYGCRLEKDLKWKCAKFASKPEADEFAFANKDNTIATHLVPSKCFDSNKQIIPDMINSKILFTQINFPVKIIKPT